MAFTLPGARNTLDILMIAAAFATLIIAATAAVVALRSSHKENKCMREAVASVCPT